MSTFNGLVDEFPDIRIDYFRTHAGRTPPAACFLSHVHSDHLAGLETLKMPFVYCSAATKQILLRMEKYSHRINFQKGILEARKQTYKHLKLILRALPLEAPIRLELSPKLVLQVTLFDANHCPGSVMFLIEGNGKAILYTGDIRAESWWVNSLVRNPIILPYACGQKTLDCVYLDTTFASRDGAHREFPTKAEGLQELLTKISTCPSETVFCFRAWTLGYEDVWVALSHALDARVHVEDYQMRLYSGIAEGGSCEFAALVGVQVGNSVHLGCLTRSDKSQIHSCEPGLACHARLAKDPNIVWITPIISRSQNGTELAELGAGGGGWDLYQTSKLELTDVASLQAFKLFCRIAITEQSRLEPLLSAIEESKAGDFFELSLQGLCLDPEEQLSLHAFVTLLSSQPSESAQKSVPSFGSRKSQQQTIHFPYSRHSSFSELRDLLSHFHPRDICPCTVDFQTWSEETSMEALFGDLCSQNVFRFDARFRDQAMKARSFAENHEVRKRKKGTDSQETASQESQIEVTIPVHSHSSLEETSPVRHEHIGLGMSDEIIVLDDDECPPRQDDCTEDTRVRGASSSPPDAFDFLGLGCPVKLTTDNRQMRDARRRAYNAAKLYLREGKRYNWDDLHLRSAGWTGHTEEEIILGSHAEL